MPDAIYYVANIAALKAIPTANLPNGARRVVGSPGTNLLPSWYTLFKAVTQTESLPVVVIPTSLTADCWIADTAKVFMATAAPTTAPLFIGQRWINTATTPVQVYEATGTTSSASWVRI
jgi:hypothetical protein